MLPSRLLLRRITPMVIRLSCVFALAVMSNGQSRFELIAGNGPDHIAALQAAIRNPTGLSVDQEGNLFVSIPGIHSSDVVLPAEVFRIDRKGQLTRIYRHNDAGPLLIAGGLPGHVYIAVP